MRPEKIMKKQLFISILVCLALISGVLAEIKPRKIVVSEPVQVVFGDNCEDLLIKEIGGAKKEILVAIYSITKRTIRDALLEAKERKVKVYLKYDAKSAEYEGMTKVIDYLAEHGIRCDKIKLKGRYAKMHHKFLVIDQKRVLTGSYNFSVPASDENYENLVLLDSVEVAKSFAREFQGIKSK